MLKKVESFKIEHDILNGREQGKRIREEILKRLARESLDIILPLNFERVKFIDFSFADEMLGTLLRRILSGELGERYIVLESLNNSLKENIDVALKARELVCVYVNARGEDEILGKLSEQLRETYFAAVRKGKITAREVLNQFENLHSMHHISAASNRLTRLQEMGLLCKTKDEVVNGGGRQYVYEPIR